MSKEYPHLPTFLFNLAPEGYKDLQEAEKYAGYALELATTFGGSIIVLKKAGKKCALFTGDNSQGLADDLVSKNILKAGGKKGKYRVSTDVRTYIANPHEVKIEKGTVMDAAKMERLRNFLLEVAPKGYKDSDEVDEYAGYILLIWEAYPHGYFTITGLGRIEDAHPGGLPKNLDELIWDLFLEKKVLGTTKTRTRFKLLKGVTNYLEKEFSRS